MIDLSILIVSYETRALLSACLDSVAKATAACPHLRIETIVVDNGSRDGSVDVARAAATRGVALIRNRGFAVAVNRGLALRRGRHVLLLNSDAEIEENVLGEGVALLDATPRVGALGVALVHPDGRSQRSAHSLPGLHTEVLPAWLFDRRPRRTPDANEARNLVEAPGPIRDVEAVRGAALFLHGDALDRVGPFDEGYFFFLEETDYCDRLRRAGFRVLQAEGLRASHRLGASSKARAPLETRIEFLRSLYRFLERRRGPRVAGIVRTLRFARSLIGCLLALPLGVLSGRQRSRLVQRWGLVLWHLRGCPADPELASALRRAAESEVGRGSRE